MSVTQRFDPPFAKGGLATSWNEELMRTAVAQAYLALLLAARREQAPSGRERPWC